MWNGTIKMNNSLQMLVSSVAAETKGYAVINKIEARFYQKLMRLSRNQLAAIKKRLAGDAGKWDTFVFLIRNRSIKKIILKIINIKEARIGEQALPEMMDDYRNIEADKKNWKGVSKEELDYIRAMVHGLRDVTEGDVNQPPE